MRHALVIGAGIGGLAAAVGLRRVGWRVTVVEQASRLGEVGAGVTLWPNALDALDALGFAEATARMERQPYNGSLRDSRGRPLFRIDQSRMRDTLRRPGIAVHRAELHGVLVEALEGDVRTGTRVTELLPDGTVPGLDIPPADLVVGADGIDSRVRASRWPDAVPATYSGFTAWRGVCDPADPSVLDQSAAGVGWGRGKEFGVVPLVDGRIYWYGAMAAPEGQREPDERATVRREFDWHRPIPDLVSATPSERVLRNDLRYLPKPLSSYRSGRVVLVGDAAHAMMPGLGQGACQALEDAAVLAYVCGRYDDLDQALDRYDAERRPRSQWIARASGSASRQALLRNPLAVGVRNLGMRLLPSSLMAGVLARPTRWTPPPSV